MLRRRPQVPSFRVSFGDNPDVESILISQPGTKKRRKLVDAKWHRDEAMRKFLWYLSRHDAEGLDATTNALIRLTGPGEALTGCFKGKRPNRKKLEALLHLWNNRGLWAIPQALKEDLCIFTDAIRYFAPPYVGEELTLYRGQSRTRHRKGVYGIAWTSRYEKAEQFSRLRGTPGVVLKVDATEDMIVAHVPTYISTPKTNPEIQWEYEDEYLPDPRKLVGKVSVAHPA